jgi:hypothetical protein
MATLLRIREWATHFENNRTKELKRMAWVPMPVKHDGDGYTELLDHENGAAHFGVWCFIVQLAAKCEPRGTLIRTIVEEDQKGAIPQAPATAPHSPATMARISRMKVRDFEEAIPRLLQIGWLEEVTEIPQEGAALRARAGGNGTERNGTEMNEPVVLDDARISQSGARLLCETQIGDGVPRTSYRDVESLIDISGFSAAKQAVLKAVSIGIGGKGAIAYAHKVLAGNAAKRELKGERSHSPSAAARGRRDE